MSRPMVLLLAAASLLVLSGCGIYQVVTLDAPLSGGASTVDGTFRIGVTDAMVSDAFRGFELYYKFYTPSQLISGGDDNLTSLALLQSRGFRRVSSAAETIDDIDRPLIVVPSADRDPDFPGGYPDYELTVDFGDVGGGFEPLVVPPAAGLLPVNILPVTIRRSIADDRTGAEDEFKPFTAFAQVDADISGNPAIWDGQFGTVLPAKLLLYVLSYGKDEAFQDVYSVPVFLDSIVINFPVGS